MNRIESLFQSVSRFRSKQLMVIMLACSIVLIAAQCCFLSYGYLSFKQESRERLGALAEIISADVGAALAFGDDQAVAKSLEAFRNDPAIKQIFVLNEQDQVSAYYHRKTAPAPDDLKLLLKEFRAEALEDFFDLRPRVESPVIRDGIRLGTILVEQDERVLTRKISVSAGISAFILLFTLGFSYLLANRFLRIITGPVTAMANAMQEVSRTRDYSSRVAASGTNEMDQLAERFNDMLSEIERRDEELLERQDRLHQLAQELTRANLQQQETAESNRRLEIVSQTKSDFLANMSHELRTPLNSVIGFSEVLQDQFFGVINPKQQEYVGNILTSGRHLLSNAVKFTPGSGTVQVSGIRKGQAIEITVADSGIGIRKEDIPRLFRTFTQLEAVYTKKYEGTGLGLALTRQLVELQGGQVWVESEYGSGSRFSFTLPLGGGPGG